MIGRAFTSFISFVSFDGARRGDVRWGGGGDAACVRARVCVACAAPLHPALRGGKAAHAHGRVPVAARPPTTERMACTPNPRA